MLVVSKVFQFRLVFSQFVCEHNHLSVSQKMTAQKRRNRLKNVVAQKYESQAEYLTQSKTVFRFVISTKFRFIWVNFTVKGLKNFPIYLPYQNRFSAAIVTVKVCPCHFFHNGLKSLYKNTRQNALWDVYILL